RAACPRRGVRRAPRTSPDPAQAGSRRRERPEAASRDHSWRQFLSHREHPESSEWTHRHSLVAMPSPSDVLAPRVTAAIAAAFGADYPELRDADPVLRPSQFADLQANAPLALAKKVGMPPREVAAKVTAHLDLAGIAEPVEISGPGFLNITLTDDW